MIIIGRQRTSEAKDPSGDSVPEARITERAASDTERKATAGFRLHRHIWTAQPDTSSSSSTLLQGRSNPSCNLALTQALSQPSLRP